MKKILVVEDEYLERETLKMILGQRSAEYKVVGEAENGLEALDFVKHHDVDIVFMDIKMPKLSGIDAAKYIKEMHPGIAVIILTAYSEFEFAQHAVKYNVDDYLLKPVRPEYIFESLQNLKRRKEGMDRPVVTSPGDLLEQFRKHFLAGDYLHTRQDLRSMLTLTGQSLEEEMGFLKEILHTFETMAGHFKVDLSEKVRMEVKSRLSPSLRKEEYFGILAFLLDEIFEEIILKKLVPYEREMEYAVQFIEKHLTRGVTLETAAQYMNISSHYFSKLFKSEMGQNFIDYVTERRVEWAKDLILSTQLPLSTIAFELGFNEANYFSKVFKKSTGETPSQYRKRMEKERSEENRALKRSTPKLNGKWLI